MAKNQEKIDAMVQNWDRLQLLNFLDIGDLVEQVGDNECVRPVSASTLSRFAIHKSHVPFLGKIGGDACSGAIVRRFGRSSIGIPCFATGLDENEKLCDVCKEIFTEHDANEFYVMDTEVMPCAKEFYKPAKAAVLWNIPVMQRMEEFFEEQIQAVKDVLEGTESEVESDWPYVSFREVSAEVLLNSGVLHRDSDKSKNAYKRDQWEYDRLGRYMRVMIENWLHICAVIDTEELLDNVKDLQKVAKKVGTAATWAVQKANPSIPIWAGPLVPADIMLAGFRAAAKPYQTLLNNLHAESDSEKLDLGECSWGNQVEAIGKWAVTVPLTRRPALRTKKYTPDTQQPPRTPVRRVQSPSAVRHWYAARGTSRPGAYVHKDVAESYNRHGQGEIKMFRSLQQVRKWLNMSPRLFFETELNPAPLPDAQQQTQEEEENEEESADEYYVVKGGTDDAIFKDMAQAIQAKNKGGGAFAVFSSRREAEVYLRPAQSFVVWVGRDVGIMDKQKCVKATQRLMQAEMCGPLSQEEAMEKWKEVKAKAKVIGEAAPTTPTKATQKKQQTPKKKKYFYAVAVGKVPGVYDTWQEAEQQVRGVRPNLHSKFLSRKKAQEFVDARAKSTAAPVSNEVEDVADVSGADDDQGKSELQIELPSMEQLEQKEKEGQIRVFACHTDIGTARIALSFDEAIAGVNNPAVQVINSKATLLDNLAEAEVRLRNDKMHVRKSIADRLAAARARAGASSHARKEATGPIKSQPQRKGRNESGAFVGVSAVGRAKQTRMILHHFLGDLDPIETNHDQVPFLHELDEDMDLPDTRAAFNPSMRDISITDFFTAKEKSLPSWPLMDFATFMSFCRKAQRMCQSSIKDGAAANAAALGELMDVALRVYRTQERMGELGVNGIRYKARMYLHLQYMSTYRVMHTSAVAMTVFSDATDVFVARLPAFKRRPQYDRLPTSKAPRHAAAPAQAKLPLISCYKCASASHRASNTKFHPVNADGSKDKVSAETRKAILAMIDKSNQPEDVKTSERENVKRYWSQHCL